MRRSRTAGTGDVVAAGSVREQELTSGVVVTLAAGRFEVPAVADLPGTVGSVSEPSGSPAALGSPRASASSVAVARTAAETVAEAALGSAGTAAADTVEAVVPGRGWERRVSLHKAVTYPGGLSFLGSAEELGTVPCCTGRTRGRRQAP